jgi:3-vinyl bacteriochlorophyllide hydratase
MLADRLLSGWPSGGMPVQTAQSNKTAQNRAHRLYTDEQRKRRDSSGWTIVQGVLAAAQFIVFLISLALVLYTLATGELYWLAASSVVLKTLTLYAIMITGSIWEKVVFGQYLFAEAFFWEDVVSMLVIALHTAYLVVLFGGFADERTTLYVALAAYVTYAINAAQFLWKLRMARREAPLPFAEAAT